jgi:hypothetical protein
MSDGSSEIRKILEDAMNIANELCCISSNHKKEAKDYFSSLLVDEAKPYLKLTSLFDGQNYTCYSKEEIEQSVSDIVGKTNLYDHIIQKINEPDHLKGGKNEYFTPQLFNDLGGQNSQILPNIERIEIGDDGDSTYSFLKFSDSASSVHHGFSISHSSDADGVYNVMFRSKDSKNMEWAYCHFKELERKIKEMSKLNEDAYLINKRHGFKFNEDEVPKHQLKRAGLAWDKLSEVQKRDLLKGEETSSVTVSVNMNGKNMHYRGHLQLSRINSNSADFIFRPNNNQGIKKMFKSKM